MIRRKNRTFAPEFDKRTMKRYRRYCTLLFLGAHFTFLLTACQSNTRWNDLEFYNVEKLERLQETPQPSEEGTPNLHEEQKREMDVKVDMQFVRSNNEMNEKACKLINDQLKEIILNQPSELSVDEAVAQYIEDVKSEFHGDDIVEVYYDHLTGRAEYGMENVINYRLVEDVFTGGAHPCKETTILRFDATTGEFISLEAIFPLEKQRELKKLLLNRLMESTHAKSLADLQAKGFLDMGDMVISHNFALREDSIEFHYNEYDIAPYAYGTCTICLSYDEAKEVMAIQTVNP